MLLGGDTTERDTARSRVGVIDGSLAVLRVKAARNHLENHNFRGTEGLQE
jgi:hypothetical protein